MQTGQATSRIRLPDSDFEANKKMVHISQMIFFFLYSNMNNLYPQQNHFSITND